jgi:HSP20 family protein
MYLDSNSISCPVDPEKTVAKYSKGVLKVTAPYQQPLEKLVDVKIEKDDFTNLKNFGVLS